MEKKEITFAYNPEHPLGQVIDEILAAENGEKLLNDVLFDLLQQHFSLFILKKMIKK